MLLRRAELPLAVADLNPRLTGFPTAFTTSTVELRALQCLQRLLHPLSCGASL